MQGNLQGLTGIGYNLNKMHFYRTTPCTGFAGSGRRSEDRDGKGALSDVLVVFLLDLERMGPVRVDARLKHLERIAVTVMVERPDVESYVRDRLPLLQAGLERCGLRIERLMCIRVRRESMSRDPVFQNDLIQEDGRIHEEAS